METRNRATLIGLVAIALWASIVGLIRGVSEGLGATGGAAAIYTAASVLLWATVGFTPLRAFPRRYLAWGSVLFVSYELCLSLSIGYANTRQQAIEFMAAHTALGENNIANEVDRYIAWPGQALAYKLGQLEILRLRAEARDRLGRRFEIRAFHDAVLDGGALPLTTLREVVERRLAGPR